MPGAPDPLHAPPPTADMSRRATLTTVSGAASTTAGEAVAAITAANIAMCLSMILLILQQAKVHVAAKTCRHLDLDQNGARIDRRKQYFRSSPRTSFSKVTMLAARWKVTRGHLSCPTA
jgi:hypothetical protein